MKFLLSNTMMMSSSFFSCICLAYIAILPPVIKGDSEDNCKSIAEIACGTNGFNLLCRAIEKIDLYNDLDDDWHDLTVFLPGDSSFRDILPRYCPSNKHYDEYGDIDHCSMEFLEEIVFTHIHRDNKLYKKDLKDRCGDLLTMVNEESTRTVCENLKQKLYQKGGSNTDEKKPQIVTFNIEACNGIIHVVDNVILPVNLPHTPRPTRAPAASSGTQTEEPTTYATTYQPTTYDPTTYYPTRNPTDDDNSSDEKRSSCSAYSACRDLGLKGDCCPTDVGMWLGCCDGDMDRPTKSPTKPKYSSSCSATPICRDKGLTGECCPTTNGPFLDCCDDVPFGSCSSNPTCRDKGLAGECCPTTNGSFLDCCNDVPFGSCSSNRKCRDLGLRGECCPAPNGLFLDCCDESGRDETPIFGNSYCTYSPNYACYVNGWPKCCAEDKGDCDLDEQPPCEIIAVVDYCSFSEDYKCYVDGRPQCCFDGNGIEDCPLMQPPCNVSCDADESLSTIKNFFCGNDKFEFLCYALNLDELKDISEVLDTSGSTTLFAPNDKAFSQLGDDTIRDLFENGATLMKDLLLYHVVSDDRILYDYDLVCDNSIDMELRTNNNVFKTTTRCSDNVYDEGTTNNKKYQVGYGNEEWNIDNWPLIIESNINKCNGVVHIINNVMLPL